MEVHGPDGQGEDGDLVAAAVTARGMLGWCDDLDLVDVSAVGPPAET